MIHLKRREDIATFLVRQQQAGAGARAPLYRLAMSGDLGVAEYVRGSAFDLATLEDARPTVVIVGDDDGLSSGPDGWPYAEKLLRWTRFVMPHGAGGEAAHYSLVGGMALLVRRAVLIETNSAQLPAWERFAAKVAPRVPSLPVRLPAGLVHPLQAAPAGAVKQ